MTEELSEDEKIQAAARITPVKDSTVKVYVAEAPKDFWDYARRVDKVLDDPEIREKVAGLGVSRKIQEKEEEGL